MGSVDILSYTDAVILVVDFSNFNSQIPSSAIVRTKLHAPLVALPMLSPRFLKVVRYPMNVRNYYFLFLVLRVAAGRKTVSSSFLLLRHPAKLKCGPGSQTPSGDRLSPKNTAAQGAGMIS